MRFGLKKRIEIFLKNLKSVADEERIDRGVVENISLVLQRYINNTQVNPDSLNCCFKKTNLIDMLQITSTYANNVLAKSDNIVISEAKLASATLDESWVVLKNGMDIVVLVSVNKT